MQKFKKKKLVSFLATLTVMIFIVVVGFSVLAEDGEAPVSENQGSGVTTTTESCLNDPEVEQAAYNAIDYIPPTRANNWTAQLQNIPADAEVMFIKEGRTESRETTEPWTLSIPLSENAAEVELFIRPKYFASFDEEKQQTCQNSYLTYTINVVAGESEVTLSGDSIAKENQFKELLEANQENSFTNNNADYNQTQKLVCSYDPTVATNQATFIGSREVEVPDNPYCKKNCQETITVSYGPPIATEAGMAIEYEVTVTSKLECQSKVTGALPEKPKVCVPTPDCNGGIFGDSHNEKAGPNEEFDSCILACDGGTYSQGCINQCYQQVYKKSSGNTPILSYTATPNDKKFDYQEGNVRTKDPLGYYSPDSNGNITWTSSIPECKTDNLAAHGNCAGFYYYKDASKKAWSDVTLKTQNGYFEMPTYTVYRSYFVDKNGFIRGYSNNVECTSTCKWLGCSGTSGVDYYLTNAEADAKYQTDLDTAMKAIESCKTEPEVSVDTATYTITVENPKGKKTSFSTTNGNYKNSMLEKDEEDQTKGTYNFPMAYIDQLNGEVKYALTANTERYQYGGNRFYTSLLSNDTNANWYDVKVNGVSLDTFNSETGCSNQQNQECSGIDYNILAEIRDYGFLEWDIDISCFYALKEDGTPPDDPDDPEPDPTPDPEPDPNPDPKYMDYIFRPISLNKVFPTSDQYPLGRNPRWNWSCGATNTRNSSYPINPVSLTSKIEEKNDSIYTDDQELDYEIRLDRQTMSKIRDYNADQDSYLDYDMSCRKINGMTVCESNFLNNAAIFGDNIKHRGKIGCNNQYGEDCDTSYSNTYNFSCITYFGNYDITNNKYKE